MKAKEKPINKVKANGNKYPLPKIKYANSNNQTLTKMKSTNNQPFSNIHINQNLDQFNIVQQNIYRPKDQKQKEEQKLNSKNTLKIKNIYDPKNKTNTKNNEYKNNYSQNNLKYLLKEFGLSEYLRKLYEYGYDNNNYLKIGTLSRKNFNNLLNNIHIFPGHTVKMEKFYEYLKKLNMSSSNHINNFINNNYNNNNNNNTYKKRKLNYNSIYGLNNGNKNNINNNFNHYYNYDNYNINKHSLNIGSNNRKNKKCLSPRGRPKTSQVKGFSKPKVRIRNNFSGNKLMKRKIENYSNIGSPFLNNSDEGNNILIKSYLNDNRKFVLNQKMNNKNLMELKRKYNGNEINNNNVFNNINGNEEYNMLYNSCNNYQFENQKDMEDKINQNIERMLNYYMVQLNDKLDKSYETVEDSSLSYIVTSQLNENKNNNYINNNIILKNKNAENKKILPNYKLPSINSQNQDSLTNRKNDKNTNNINNCNNILKLKNKMNDKNIVKENKEKEKDIKNNESLTKNEKNVKPKEEKKEIIEEDIKKVENKIKDEYVKDIKKLSDHETSTKSKDSKEHEIEEDEILFKDKKPIQNPFNLKEKEKEQNNINNINNKEKEKEPTKQMILDDSYLLNEKYSLEQNIYDTLRLNRSMDAENINKDTLKFDIEFMCRCLGLALMKHIEQGKEKQHITELYNQEQTLKFYFYNSGFNKNINLLTDFFKTNTDNNKLGDLNLISILEKYCLENDDIDNDDIDFIKHIKKTGDEKIIQKDDIHEETFKLRNGLADYESEIKFIGDFFSYPRKKSKNYQDVSENTKKILCKDLSYIKEMDSEMNKTGNSNSNTINNRSRSNISKSNNNSKINKIENNSEYNMSKQDSKSNDENKNKIIDEEEKDEDYNYEDEFLNDINIDDKNDKKNKEEKNINNENKNENEEKKDDSDSEDKFLKDNIKENKDIKESNNINEKDKNDKGDNLNNINKNEIKEEIKKDKIEEELSINKNENKEDDKKEVKEINTNTNINEMTKINQINRKDILTKNTNANKDEIESNYIIDADNITKFKEYLLNQFEIFDDDFLYYTMSVPVKRFMAPPDPQAIFEFCANIMILTKMEKEVIIISLIYIERLIFNTGFIINSRNWRKIIFIALIIASKLWDDDSLENIHYSQVFTHLKVGEINLLERTFLELINYKVFVKFSEYMKYYFAIKNMALRYNFNGEQIVPVSVEKMMKIQEYAYQMQKRMRKKISLNNSAHF